MEIHAITLLQQHPLYTEFKQQHPDSFLAHLFFQNNTIHAGYYLPTTHAITTFLINQDNTERIDNQEILHKEPTIQPLNLITCILTPEQAKEQYHHTAKQFYPRETTTKIFIILQQNNQEPYYNITGLTISFKTLNIQLSATNGTILSTTCETLAQKI